jgi:hypothetical protein
MATQNKRNNIWTNVQAIFLRLGTLLNFGQVAKVESIDATSGGDFTIHAIAVGALYGIKCSSIEFDLVGVSALTGVLVLSVGNNSGGGNNNILGSSTLTGLNSTFRTFTVHLTGTTAKSYPGDTIRGNITGVLGGTALLTVTIRGERFLA